MTAIQVPEEGLLLPSSPSNESVEGHVNLAQVIQLDLENGMLHDLMKAARQGRAPQLSFGKTISLHYGNRHRALSSDPITCPTSFYSCLFENPHEVDFNGCLSHKLELLQRAEKDLAGVDDALATLQSSLASAEQVKQSNKIKFLPDSSSLPPPKKQTVASLKQGSSKGSSLSFLKKNKDSITRSMPSSPAVGPLRRPPVSSKPIPKSTLPQGRNVVTRHQAIRKPLIHLLASRCLSTGKVAQQLSCREEDALFVLEKVGKSVNEGKWTLKDAFFKELDVWQFPYPDAEQRTAAIERAVSAFDRMRLSSQDPIFQKLLKREERGKGKSLSKLNHLNKGPIQHSSTPRIHVHNSDDSGKRSPENEDERQSRATVKSTQPAGRSKSQEVAKKKRASEKEAQSKRLLSKGPKKSAAVEKEKKSHPAVNKGVKKASAPLSNEFVHDSDEEDGLKESIETEVRPTQTAKKSEKEIGSHASHHDPKPRTPKPAVVTKKNDIETSEDKANKNSTKPSKTSATVGSVKPRPSERVPERRDTKSANGPRKRDVNVAQKTPHQKPRVPTPDLGPKLEDSQGTRGSTPMEKKSPRSRNTSSPHKPSPLASSPPANVSNMDEHPHSSVSSTSLIETKERESTSQKDISSNTLNGSQRTLKRKATEMDGGDQVSSKALPNGHATKMPNGHIKPTKRPRTGELTPPSSDSPSPPPATISRAAVLEKAKLFKDQYYPKYSQLYHQLRTTDDPDPKTVAELWKMHDRLTAIKEEIRDAW